MHARIHVYIYAGIHAYMYTCIHIYFVLLGSATEEDIESDRRLAQDCATKDRRRNWRSGEWPSAGREVRCNACGRRMSSQMLEACACMLREDNWRQEPRSSHPAVSDTPAASKS